MDVFSHLRKEMMETMTNRDWSRDEVRIKVKTLTPHEAIGDPEHDDYPLVKGRERMMMAEFRGCQGQAFTDRFGDFEGCLADVAGMELTNNFRRAVFIAALNAVLRARGTVDRTIHCKDEAPPQCAEKLAETVALEYGSPKVALVGLQPRMAHALAKRFPLRITDMDRDNIGQVKFGVVVEGEEANPEMLDWCDLALVTGTTFSNDSVTRMLGSKPIVFYGVTAAGPAAVLGLDRFCPLAA